MNSEKAWSFGDDADRDHPLTAHRIAVTGSHPSWCYLVAFDRESQAATPSEVAMLVSFLEEYKAHWYNDRYLAKLAARPLDVDGAANGTIFRKWGTDDWGYRKQSWIRGPLYVPQSPMMRERYPAESPSGPLPLEKVMDRIYTLGSDEPSKRWVAWKAQHPDVFGS